VRTPIDTQIRTHHAARVATKEKRTYNLTAATVRAVRELADDYHAAPTQDAVVELAVSELARRLRDAEEAHTWEVAGADPEFIGEAQELEHAYRGADRETWPA
jgi:hypothetical protein